MSVTATCTREGAGELALRFTVKGDTTRLRLPERKAPARQDGLWRTTCFEVFVHESDGYWEFNASPSSEWAAYRFAGYRRGGEDDPGATVRNIETALSPETLEATFEIAHPPCARNAAIRIGLSAIIETNEGAKSYWALAHPPGDPDFHHQTSFAFALEEAFQS